MYWTGKELSKPKTQNIRNPSILYIYIKIKDRIIRDIWALFKTEEENKERKKIERKKKKLLID